MFANGVQRPLKVVGQRSFKFHSFSSDRMVKPEFQSVQRLTSNEDFVLFFGNLLQKIRPFQRRVTFIQSVGDNRVSQVMHVDS